MHKPPGSGATESNRIIIYFFMKKYSNGITFQWNHSTPLYSKWFFHCALDPATFVLYGFPVLSHVVAKYPNQCFI